MVTCITHCIAPDQEFCLKWKTFKRRYHRMSTRSCTSMHTDYHLISVGMILFNFFRLWGSWAFYEELGWERWKGALYFRPGQRRCSVCLSAHWHSISWGEFCQRILEWCLQVCLTKSLIFVLHVTSSFIGTIMSIDQKKRNFAVASNGQEYTVMYFLNFCFLKCCLFW